MSKEECLEILVIGAGVAGLSCAINLARTAERLHEVIRVTIVESRDGPGGTWSTAAVYPGLITNNSWRAMLIEDQSGKMAQQFEQNPEYGAGPGLHRATGPAMTVHMRQLAEKAKEFGAAILYNSEVLSIEKESGGGWRATMQAKGSDSTVVLYCDKLVCAAGSFSTASVPSFVMPHWQYPLPASVQEPLILHTQQLSAPQAQLVTDAAREVIVVGASKSAMDSAERFALLGKKVTLVVKNAPYLAPPSFHDKAGNPTDASAGVASRLFTAYIPYFRDPVSGLVSSGGTFCSWFRAFLHGTYLGGIIQRALEKKVTGIFAEFNQWSAGPNNAAMRPETPMTWLEASTYPGPEHLPQLIKEGRVTILRGAAVDVRHKSDTTYELDVRMNDGSLASVQANVLVFGTGWRTGEHKFFDRALANELGMPHRYRHLSDRPDREAFFEELDTRSTSRLLRECRTLRQLPPEWSSAAYGARAAGADPTTKVAPFRLYRMMVPLSHLHLRDIVFPGITTNKANTVLADVQAHWIADYLLDNLPSDRRPSFSKAAEEISMHTTWSRRLFGPAQGELGAWLGTAWFEYCGRLCHDMSIAADGCGLTGVLDSSAFKVEEKRVKRDQERRLAL